MESPQRLNYTAVDGAEIGWEEHGAEGGPALLLLHSLGCSSSMWRPQLPIATARFRVVTIDLRGHGASSSPPGPYTIEQLGRDVEAVAGAAGVDLFHVCGVSMGGMTAMWLAAQRASRIASVVIANAAPRMGSASLWNERIAAVRDGGMESVREAVVGRFFSGDFARRHPEELSAANEIFSATDADGYVACCAAIRDADLRDMVAGITAPTLVVGGELDVASPPDQLRRLHDAIPGSRLRMIEGAGHLSNLDRPNEFNEAAAAFWDSVVAIA